DGIRPAINYLLRDFRKYLIQKKIDQDYDFVFEQQKQRRFFGYTNNKSNNNNDAAANTIDWIESNILQGQGISDYRKTIIDLVLASYLVNVKKYDYNTAYYAILKWLDKCAAKRPLTFNVNYKIRSALNRVSDKKDGPV